MATFLIQKIPGLIVEILDGEFLSDEEIINRLDADFVGINANTVTYPQALIVAEAAKEIGATTVLGGVYVSALPELIMEKRSKIIDHAVVGYGEIPMLSILKGTSQKILKNLVPPFNHMDYTNREFLDINQYIDRFQKNHPTWNYRATNIFTNVGCTWRDKSEGGCIFCSRSGESAQFNQAQSIWNEIRYLKENFGIDYVVDFSDTLLQNTEWLQTVINTKPEGLDLDWHIFSKADEINPYSLELALKLPSEHIFVGMESGDKEIYKQVRKGGGSPDKNLDAARLMRAYDMQMTPSYVLGLPGETEDSLKRTLEHATELYDIIGFEEMFCCELIPFPGSIAFKKLIQSIGKATDLYNIEELKYSWVKTFCPELKIDELQYYVKQILELAKYKITITNTIQDEATSYTCI